MSDDRPSREEPHDGSRTFIRPAVLPVTIADIHEAYARRLRELNRRDLLAGGTSDIQTQDPRDILVHIEALACRMSTPGTVPPMDLVDALGAQVLALGLAVARDEAA